MLTMAAAFILLLGSHDYGMTQPPSTTLSCEQLVRLIAARDTAISKLYFEFHLCETGAAQIKSIQGRWARDGKMIAAAVENIDHTGLVERYWETWDGAYDRLATGKGASKADANKAGPEPSDYDVLEIGRQTFDTLLLRQYLPAQFGLLSTNNNWSDYLDQFIASMTISECSIDKNPCWKLVFDMAKGKGERPFPWVVWLEKRSLLAIRTEAYISVASPQPTVQEPALPAGNWQLFQRLCTTRTKEVEPGLWVPLEGTIEYGPAGSRLSSKVRMCVDTVSVNREIPQGLFTAFCAQDGTIVDRQLMAAGVSAQDLPSELRTRSLIDRAVRLTSTSQGGQLSNSDPEQGQTRYSQVQFEVLALCIAAGATSDSMEASKVVAQSLLIPRSKRMSDSDLSTIGQQAHLSLVNRELSSNTIRNHDGWYFLRTDHNFQRGYDLLCKSSNGQLFVLDRNLEETKHLESDHNTYSCLAIESGDGMELAYPKVLPMKHVVLIALVGILGLAAVLIFHRVRVQRQKGAKDSVGQDRMTMLVALLLVGISVACNPSSAPLAGPSNSRVAVPPECEDIVLPEGADYDGGKVLDDKPLTHAFLLYNQSAQEVRVESLISSCTCSSAEIIDKVIPPNGIGYVVATMETTHKLGRQGADLVVQTRGVCNQQVHLSIVAHIGPQWILRVSPLVIDFGEYRNDSRTERNLLVTAIRTGDQEPTEDQLLRDFVRQVQSCSDIELVQYSFEQQHADGKFVQLKFHASIRPRSDNNNPWEDRIVFSQGVSVETLRLSGRLQAQCTRDSRRIFLGSLTQHQIPAERKLWIDQTENLDYVTRIDPVDIPVGIRIHDGGVLGSRRSIVVEVMPDAQDSSGLIERTIYFKVGTVMIEVQIVGYVLQEDQE